MIAALYVQRDGAYFGLDGVDPWDETRDARTYPGPWPVVAHPPCERWCQLAHVNQARYGHRVGDDGGCFRAALAAVRTWGGVLEHPAWSYAWPAFGLPEPMAAGWTRELLGPGWVCEVSQRAYGHKARKLTWLYYIGDAPPPVLDWSRPEPAGTVSFLTNHGGGGPPSVVEEAGERNPARLPRPAHQHRPLCAGLGGRMIAALLRDLEAALRAGHGDHDHERLSRVADVLTRHAVLASDRDAAHRARLIATDLREIAARMEGR